MNSSNLMINIIDNLQIFYFSDKPIKFDDDDDNDELLMEENILTMLILSQTTRSSKII